MHQTCTSQIWTLTKVVKDIHIKIWQPTIWHAHFPKHMHIYAHKQTSMAYCIYSHTYKHTYTHTHSHTHTSHTYTLSLNNIHVVTSDRGHADGSIRFDGREYTCMGYFSSTELPRHRSNFMVHISRRCEANMNSGGIRKPTRRMKPWWVTWAAMNHGKILPARVIPLVSRPEGPLAFSCPRSSWKWRRKKGIKIMKWYSKVKCSLNCGSEVCQVCG